MKEIKGAFRPKPWPLGIIRRLLHLYRLNRLKLLSKSSIVHGSPIFIAKNSDVRAPHFVKIGDRVSFGKNFTCEADLVVGNDVLISSNVSIVGKDHPFTDPKKTVFEHDRVDDSVVTIGSDVLIGFGVTIIGTVKIGDGCIVGAGAVVAKDLDSFTVCVGSPARPIRSRYPVECRY